MLRNTPARWLVWLLFTFAFIGLSATASAAPKGVQGYYSHPDVHGNTIVFVAENDLWTVSTSGGIARRLTHYPGREYNPRFSPDGKWIAFTASYNGDADVYVIPVNGGALRRLTYRTGPDMVVGWLPDGSGVVFKSRRDTYDWHWWMYSIKLNETMPKRIKMGYAGFASFMPGKSNGNLVAFNRFDRAYRTWKRYTGGWAQDIWIGNIGKRVFKKLTSYPGTDSFPMFGSDKRIYFSSDRTGIHNLYSMKIDGSNKLQHTFHTKWDVRWPAIGGHQIVYQSGADLRLYNTKTRKDRLVSITLNTVPFRRQVRPVNAVRYFMGYDISDDGKRLLVNARGDLYNVPVKEGATYRITRSSTSREKYPIFLPGSRKVLAVTDKSGEEQLCVYDALGEKKAKALTTTHKAYLFTPAVSPNGKWIAYGDKNTKLWVLQRKKGAKPILVRAKSGWEIRTYRWSPDSRYLAYVHWEPNRNGSIFIYDTKTKRNIRATRSWTNDFDPAWSPNGKTLYFLSRRRFNPVYGTVDFQEIVDKAVKVYALSLTRKSKAPFAPKDSAAAAAGRKKKKKKLKKKVKKAAKALRKSLRKARKETRKAVANVKKSVGKLKTVANKARKEVRAAAKKARQKLTSSLSRAKAKLKKARGLFHRLMEMQGKSRKLSKEKLREALLKVKKATAELRRSVKEARSNLRKATKKAKADTRKAVAALKKQVKQARSATKNARKGVKKAAVNARKTAKSLKKKLAGLKGKARKALKKRKCRGRRCKRKKKVVVKIDEDGLLDRAYALPKIPAGHYFGLNALKGKLLFVTRPTLGMMDRFNSPAFRRRIMILSYSLRAKKLYPYARGTWSYALSSNKKFISVRYGMRFLVLPTRLPRISPKMLRKAKRFYRMMVQVNPAQEWKQIFDEAGRFQRDFFWANNLANIDWKKVQKQYKALLPRLLVRRDLHDVLGQLIGELGTSHAYIWGGDSQRRTTWNMGGLLGAKVGIDAKTGLYQFTKLYKAPPWAQGDNPTLSYHHNRVKVGTYLLAINGQKLTKATNVFKLLQHKFRQHLVLTVNSKPSFKGSRRIVIKAISRWGARKLRYNDWVESRRLLTLKWSKGKVGYIHLPNMSAAGLLAFYRMWYPQLDKRAMLIDIRGNGGGFVSQHILQKMMRRIWAFFKPRNAKSMTVPSRVFHGHLACLTSQIAGSDGDIFGQTFQSLKLGPVFGMRSWGGVVGIRGGRPFVDYGAMTIPEYAWWSPNVKWKLENRGVKPDYPVENSPADMENKFDRQLKMTVDYLVKKLKEDPKALPKLPAFPDKSLPAFRKRYKKWQVPAAKPKK